MTWVVSEVTDGTGKTLRTAQESIDNLRENTRKARARVLTAFEMDADELGGSDRADCIAGAVLRFFDLTNSAIAWPQNSVRLGTEALYPWIKDLDANDHAWEWAITCARSLYNMKKGEEERDGRFTR